MCATGDVGTIIKNDNSTKPYEVKASDGKTWWYHKEALSAVCDVGGCTRVTWNGDFGAQCCRTCKSSGGASHGPECEAKAKKAACPSVSPSSTDSVRLEGAGGSKGGSSGSKGSMSQVGQHLEHAAAGDAEDEAALGGHCALVLLNKDLAQRLSNAGLIWLDPEHRRANRRCDQGAARTQRHAMRPRRCP